ncbi:MAG: MCM family protein [Candidatus Parvarchaeum acidophilus ARMAN-5]|jgi:replicative DNA helicase Mcm|uniref:DNA helicase n=1 Tax=Candidatus Parvarchaeum acidophilus ARMAN-5 TaxID=662762 RepID=D6GVP3_PARA5|nr:MAG: MCM family protein [Candidatus Parvarchaeum acidophilus ARMAN-5]
MKNELDGIISNFVNKRLSENIKEVLTTNKNAIVLDFDEIDQFSPELGDSVLKQPEETLDTIKYFVNETSIPHKALDIEIRVKNLPKNAQMLVREIRSKHIGLLVQVQGLIKTAASVRPVASAIDFECQSCGHITKVEQKDMTQKAPSICTNCGKKGRFKSVKKYLVDTQRITLEEAPEDLEGGEQPEHINIILKKDLVDPKFERNIIPGNKVIVSGIINESAIYYPSGKRSNTSDTFISASFVEAVEQGYEDVLVTKEEEMAIRELANDKMIYNKLKNSIAPNIYGHDNIKEAIVLQLFGGVRKIAASGNSVIRGDMHILLVGDPGTSKSSMLKYIAGIAPKARYVVGMGSSAAGLTATIVKDDATRSYILEAGALPLTNKGLLMIDELDKMNKDDRVAMHEALEQQTISISKANIHATLSAQTSVLAAANPKMGRFNPFDVISAQIELPPTLINRFDLIFILKDRPDKETDMLIAQRILEANKDINKNKPEIPPNIMKKYIAFAKQNIKPKLSMEAMKAIEEFYLKLRAQYSTEGDEVKPIPISARQLEAIVRLTEASAKVKLSDYATLEDAKRAIDLMMSYLGDVGVDSSTGQLDIDRIITGIPSSQRNTALTIKSIIKSEVDNMPMGSAVALSKIYDAAEKVGIDNEKVDAAITVLKKEGEIFEPKPSFIKLL